MKIGWIGTGVMGLSMCRRLMAAGHELVVHTRTKERAEPLLAEGASWAPSPAEVTSKVDAVFTMVGFPADVEAVWLGEQGVLSTARAGQLLVDMTTTRPSLAERIAAAARGQGARFVDAPVSGGDVGAQNGTLSIMVGGEEDAVATAMPLFEVMGRQITHQGRAGAGQHTKMCNQITIAGTMIGVSECLVYAARAGLDPTTVLTSISSGAAGCWTLENLAPRVLRRDFGPGFYIDHFIKDMEIALDEARRLELSLPGLALVHQLYRAIAAQGKGRCGTQALILALEQLAGMTHDAIDPTD